MIRRFLFLALLTGVFAITETPAQNPYIRQYTSYDGLPTNNINGVFQDSRKFLWFATDAGAVKFDGSRFLTFAKKDGLNTDGILQVKEDSTGRIWIFNRDGTLNYISGNKIFNSGNAPFLDSLRPNDPFHDFFQDEDGTIYFYNAMYEVFVLDSGNHVRKIEKIKAFLCENLRDTAGLKVTGPFDSVHLVSHQELYVFNLYLIRRAQSGGYLLWTRRGLIHVSSLFKDPVLLRGEETSYQRSSFSRKSDFHILAFGNYIVHFRNERPQKLIRLPFNLIYTMSRSNALFLDREGYYWAGTFDDGLYCLSTGTPDQRSLRDDVPAGYNVLQRQARIVRHLDIRRVNGIIQDHEGNIWISSYGEGVFKISPYLNAHRHFAREMFGNRGIREMAPARPGGVWLSSGRTIYLLRDNKMLTLDFRPQNKYFDFIYHLGSGQLILGEKYSYFYVLHNIRTDRVQDNILFSKPQKSILYMSGLSVSEKGNKLSCYNYFNFDLLDPDTLFGTYKNDYFQKDFNVGSRIYNTWYNGRDELVINAKRNYILAHDTCIPFDDLAGLDNRIVTQHLNLDPETELFNIENETIKLFHKRKFYDLTAAFGMPRELHIKNISYRVPVLYMADAVNIYTCVNPLDIIRGKPVKLRLVDINFRNISKVLALDDTLYIASDDGLTMIPEKSLGQIISSTPIPYIQSVTVNDQEEDLSKGRITFTGGKTVKIRFGSINYSSTPVIYSFMLEGAGRKWSSGTGDIIVYKDLPRGDYRFKLRVGKQNAGWSPPVSFDLKIRYTFWQHPLVFLGLVLILLAAIVAVIVMRKNRQIRRREMDHQMVTLEQKALQSMMNPHFIFNSLGSIQNYLLQNKTAEAGLYLSQFARLIRQNINALKETMINLDDETDRLKNYLDLEKMRSMNKFDYRIETDDSIGEDDVYIPSMIIQPFAENSIWHGITPLEGQGRIIIAFSKASELTLRIVVEDNGIGMKKAAHYASKSREHLGLTLDLTRKRLDLLGRKYHVPTRISFSDAFPENENPGTRVEIIVPFTYNNTEH